jgi:hypothetical protein
LARQPIQQDFPEAIIENNGRITDGVGSARDSSIDLAKRDLVADMNAGLNACATGPLHIHARCL